MRNNRTSPSRLQRATKPEEVYQHESTLQEGQDPTQTQNSPGEVVISNPQGQADQDKQGVEELSGQILLAETTKLRLRRTSDKMK